jgi:hypothetical protein
MEQQKYVCETCKRVEFVSDIQKIPQCCGKPMKKVFPKEICLQPEHSSSARPMENDDACDDFRAGT